MTHDATDRAKAVHDLIEQLENDGHEVHGWDVSEDGRLYLDVTPSGIGGGNIKS